MISWNDKWNVQNQGKHCKQSDGLEEASDWKVGKLKVQQDGK